MLAWVADAGPEAHVKQLATARWRCLTELSFSGGQADMHLYSLAVADWPQLTVLTIKPYSSNALTAISRAGSLWHTLRHLILRDGDGAVKEVLALVETPGQALYVDCKVADPAQAAPSVDSWPGDTRLHVAVYALCKA